MLFELWFKQILHELTSVSDLFKAKQVDETTLGTAVSRLNRIVQIQGLMIDQIRILETMTPLDFLEFRNYLFPASGFQSFQFRQVEVLLGLQDKQRITYNKVAYDSPFSQEQQHLLNEVKKYNLFNLVEKWLDSLADLVDHDLVVIIGFSVSLGMTGELVIVGVVVVG